MLEIRGKLQFEKKSSLLRVLYFHRKVKGMGEKEKRWGKENRYYQPKMSNYLVNIFVIRGHPVLTRSVCVCVCERACLYVCALMNNSSSSLSINVNAQKGIKVRYFLC